MLVIALLVVLGRRWVWVGLLCGGFVWRWVSLRFVVSCGVGIIRVFVGWVVGGYGCWRLVCWVLAWLIPVCVWGFGFGWRASMLFGGEFACGL